MGSLIKEIGENKTAIALAARVLNLLNELSEELKNQAEQFAALPDDQLFRELFLTLATHRTIVSQRELRKQVQRLNADHYFLDTIKENGGLYKAGDVAKIMNVSRQTINNQRIAEKLIAIKRGGEYLYPAFQFNQRGKIEGLDDVLKLMNGMGVVTKCSFLLTKINFNGNEQSPIDILKNKLGDEYLSYILREAALYGSHSAR